MDWLEWMGKEVNPGQHELIATLVRCHQIATVQNDNVSSASVKLAASVGTPFPQSVASALITLGGDIHGPTEKARQVIYVYNDQEIRDTLSKGERIAGWGNAFYNGTLDPAWTEMDSLVRARYPHDARRLDRISAIISAYRDRTFIQNAAAYTAVTAQIIGMPQGVEILLAIVARLPAWAAQYLSQQRS